MKRSLNHFRRYSARTIFYISLSILFAGILFYSCRKVDRVLYGEAAKLIPFNSAAVITKNDLLKWYEDLPAPERGALNSEDGLKSIKGKLPFPLKWDKAMQRIINGKHVIKVPVASNSAMLFVKQGPNGTINAYSYRWSDKTKKGEDFSGKVQQFNFQDFTFHQKTYINGKIINPLKFVFKNAPTLDQINALKNEIKSQKNPASGRKIVTNSIWDFLESVRNVIGNTIAAIGCTLLGGEFDDCGGDLTDNRCVTFDVACDLDGAAETDEFSGGISDVDYYAPVTFTVHNSNSGGSSSGGESGGESSNSGTGSGGPVFSIGSLTSLIWSTVNIMTGGQYNITGSGYTAPPPPAPMVTAPQIAAGIANLGNLNQAEKDWIESHKADNWGSSVVLAALAANSNYEKMMIKKHINLMLTQADYPKVVNGYYYHSGLGANTPYMWWQDPTYIGAPDDHYTNESLYYLDLLNIPEAGDTYTDPSGNTLQYTTLNSFLENNPSVIEQFVQGDADQISWPSPMMSMIGIDYTRSAINNYEILKIQHPNWSETRLIGVAGWQALSGTVHFALDVAGMIPGEGTVANFLNGAIYYVEGDRINAAISFGSMVPVVSWLKIGGKWVRQAAKISTNPYIGTAVMKAGRRAIISGTNVRFIKVTVDAFDYASVKALKAIKPADQTLRNISSYLVDQFGHRIKPTATALINDIDDIALHGDAGGTKTEALSHAFFETEGYTKYNGQFGSNNGFDGVYIKGPLSNPTDIIINEAKPMSAYGSIQLNAGNTTSQLPPQMSDDWVDNVIGRMEAQGGSLTALAQTLGSHKSLITKTVTTVDKTRKEFVVLRLGAY